MHDIILALGANVGDKKKNIFQAISLLGTHIHNIRCAELYSSKAVGHEDQPDFINTAIFGKTKLDPEQLLKFTQNVEKKIGRTFRFHWGPREIDIDIIFYDDLVYHSKTLEIPHPLMQDRDFVLLPLRDIIPNFKHPVLDKTVAQLC